MCEEAESERNPCRELSPAREMTQMQDLYKKALVQYLDTVFVLCLSRNIPSLASLSNWSEHLETRSQNFQNLHLRVVFPLKQQWKRNLFHGPVAFVPFACISTGRPTGGLHLPFFRVVPWWKNRRNSNQQWSWFCTLSPHKLLDHAEVWGTLAWWLFSMRIRITWAKTLERSVNQSSKW